MVQDDIEQDATAEEDAIDGSDIGLHVTSDAHTSATPDQALLDDNYRFVVKLEGHASFSKTGTQYVIENTRDLMKCVQGPLVTSIKEMQTSKKYDMDKLLSIIDANSVTLQSLSTQHHRYKVFEKRGWVRPVPITVGNRVDSVVAKGRSVQKTVAVNYQYVPLISSLKNILSNHKIKTLIRHSTRHTDNHLFSFMDGSKFTPVQNCGLHLVLALYCDDIEIANPLGAKSGVHKLAMYYYSILNLPPEILSTVSHIHLLAVAVAQDVKLVGHNRILEQFVTDMRRLQNGVIINDEIVKASLGVLCADNLAANSLLNMTESFVADNFCRFCILGRTDAHRCCTTPEHAVLRTKEIQKTAADSSTLGVKGVCILDDLDHFSVENFSPDIMHDLLEGVCRKEMGLVINHYLSQKCFTLDYLNGAIDGFSYSYTERSTRPRGIPKPVSGKLTIKESASMMLTLVRILPLLIGHLISEDCEYWRLFTSLREIIDIVMSPVLSIDVSYYIEALVSDHHALFLRLFPDEHLTPKYHFLLHYGEAIRRCGPLRHLWCMRFESKHQLAKRVGELSNNFRNIALTVATQYTITEFSKWELDDIWPETTIGCAIDRNHVASLTYRSVLFKPGCIIHHGTANEKPILSLVNSISCENSVLTFNCSKLVVEEYNTHFCAHPVTVSCLPVDVPLKDLKSTQPLFIHHNLSEQFVFFPCTFTASFNPTTLY